MALARGMADIQVRHINSHITLQEAEAAGFPRHARIGYYLADKLASLEAVLEN